MTTDNEEKKFLTRLGDGSAVYMTEAEIRDDIGLGMADAVKRAKVPPLTEEDVEKLVEIIMMPGVIVGVEHGKQVVTTTDAGSHTLNLIYGIPVEKSVESQIHEKAFGCDSVDIGYADYSFKAVKAIAYLESMILQNSVKRTVIPILYGSMPNLGLYTKPDGPVDNWAELLPAGKVDEARAAQEEAVDYSVKDIVHVSEQMYEAGADGINMDTSGAAGDADLCAALKATEIIREKYPTLGVEMGMSSEFVIGMHGKIEYKGTRLAGLFPHQQVKVCEKAGVTVFGAVVNTNTSYSLAWNLARVCTMIKECSKVAEIPVHANVGMGVCGIPMSEVPAQDAVARVDKALVEICGIDGL
jgi:dimethylamine--corrinoid protein Co-methyltransferase